MSGLAAMWAVITILGGYTVHLLLTAGADRGGVLLIALVTAFCGALAVLSATSAWRDRTAAPDRRRHP